MLKQTQELLESIQVIREGRDASSIYQGPLKIQGKRGQKHTLPG
jgi:hypothetical protein